MKILFSFLVTLWIAVSGYCEGTLFTDSFTNMTFRIPEGFSLNQDESKLDTDEGIWWYEFTDPNQSVLIIEVERYDSYKDLTDHFRRALTDDEDTILFEGLEFKHLNIDGIDMSKCKVRALVVSDKLSQPLYICDYFFVQNGFGISVGLMKKDDELYDDEKMEALMTNLLYSIHFEKMSLPQIQ